MRDPTVLRDGLPDVVDRVDLRRPSSRRVRSVASWGVAARAPDRTEAGSPPRRSDFASNRWDAKAAVIGKVRRTMRLRVQPPHLDRRLGGQDGRWVEPAGAGPGVDG
jgi:hypothetical protein